MVEHRTKKDDKITDEVCQEVKREQNILAKVKARTEKKLNPDIVKEFEQLAQKQEQKLNVKAEDIVKEKIERKNMFKDNVVKLLKSFKVLPKYIIKNFRKKS